MKRAIAGAIAAMLIATCMNTVAQVSSPNLSGRSLASNTAPLPKLNWGSLFFERNNQSPDVTAELGRVLQVAQESLNLRFIVLDSLHLAGTLNNDPLHQQSDEAVAQFGPIFDLAVCARLAASPLREQCLAKAESALVSWASTYQPTGNPIDEGFLVPLFQAADLLIPVIQDAQRAALKSWLVSIALKEDEFYKRMKPSDSRLVNNWASWRLLIRGMITQITEDPRLADTPALLTQFANQNFLKDSDGRPTGQTFDYVQRDAFHYHIFDLLPMVELGLNCPSLRSKEFDADVLAGIQFMKPYFLGQLQHIEFVHTTVQFDIDRCHAGQKDYCDLPWVNSTARPVLRLARSLFPEISDWTSSVIDEKYDPRIKLMAAVFAPSALHARGD